MTEQEKRQAELAAKYENGHLATDANDKQKGREKAAKDWIEKFYAVLEFIDTLDDNEDLSIENLTKLLASSWEVKEHDKNVTINRKIKALKQAS